MGCGCKGKPRTTGSPPKPVVEEPKVEEPKTDGK